MQKRWGNIYQRNSRWLCGKGLYLYELRGGVYFLDFSPNLKLQRDDWRNLYYSGGECKSWPSGWPVSDIIVVASDLTIAGTLLGRKEVCIKLPTSLIQTHTCIWAFWSGRLTLDATVMVCLTELKHKQLKQLEQSHGPVWVSSNMHTHTGGGVIQTCVLMGARSHSISMW